MTKDSILDEYVKYAWECDQASPVIPYSDAERAMEVFGREHALAFAKYVMVDYKLSLGPESPILSDEEIYNQFIEQQNKE